MKINDYSIRSNIRKQKFCLWFTGLSGAGKTTIAQKLTEVLNHQGTYTYLLDGDIIRQGINNDLGFSNVDRIENIRRIAHISNILLDAGLIVLVGVISPTKEMRKLAKMIIGREQFIEVFVDCSFEVCRKRDPKGLYKKAENGLIKDFTNVSSEHIYETPDEPDIVLHTEEKTIDECVTKLIEYLRCRFG